MEAIEASSFLYRSSKPFFSFKNCDFVTQKNHKNQQKRGMDTIRASENPKNYEKISKKLCKTS